MSNSTNYNNETSEITKNEIIESEYPDTIIADIAVYIFSGIFFALTFILTIGVLIDALNFCMECFWKKVKKSDCNYYKPIPNPIIRV